MSDSVAASSTAAATDAAANKLNLANIPHATAASTKPEQPAAYGRRRVMVVAIDNTDFSEKVLDFVARSLVKDNDEVYILNYLDVSFDFGDAFYLGLNITTVEMETQLSSMAEKRVSVILNAAMGKFSHAKNVHVVSKVICGNPKDEGGIIDFAKKVQAEMIVVGSHGKGAFERVFVGSVSSYVVHNANIPVVVVKEGKK